MFLEGVCALAPSTLSHQTGVSNYRLRYTEQVIQSSSAFWRFWSVKWLLEVFCISELNLELEFRLLSFALGV